MARGGKGGLSPPPLGRLGAGFQKPVLLFKTGTVAQKNDFCIFGFRNIKYKKPDPVYRPGPDRKRKKNPETGGSRPVFETLDVSY